MKKYLTSSVLISNMVNAGRCHPHRALWGNESCLRVQRDHGPGGPPASAVQEGGPEREHTDQRAGSAQPESRWCLNSSFPLKERRRLLCSPHS